MTRFICLLAIFSTVLLSARLPAEQPTGQTFDSDGVRIHYVEKGQGEPVVLIHGFTASHQMNWEMPGITDALAENYRVIGIDNRGHGKSDKPHGADQYGEQMVKDVVRLLDHLEIDKAHIVGYSMGGFITGNLVVNYPDRVASAVIGAAGWHEHPQPHFALLDEIGNSLESGDGIGPLLKHLTPEGQQPPSERVLKSSTQLLMLMNDPKALAAAIRGMKGLMVSREQLAANEVPTVAVVGSIDPLKEGVDEMATVMSNLEVVIIEGADHMTAIGNPQLLETIEAHLKKNAMLPVAAN